jgi:hypothetical protein
MFNEMTAAYRGIPLYGGVPPLAAGWFTVNRLRKKRRNHPVGIRRHPSVEGNFLATDFVQSDLLAGRTLLFYFWCDLFSAHRFLENSGQAGRV